jgi:hypothetical protein
MEIKEFWYAILGWLNSFCHYSNFLAQDYYHAQQLLNMRTFVEDYSVTIFNLFFELEW